MAVNKKKLVIAMASLVGLTVASTVLADSSGGGIAGVANAVKGNLGAVAKLITAGSYVAGMAFGVGAIVKFKAHKDNPTQIPIGTPIALLFVSAALLFIPGVFKASGTTMFSSGAVSSVSGVSAF